MTAAQVVFAFCGLVLAPVLGFLVSRNRVEKPDSKPIFTPARIVWGMLVLCGIVAKVTFPDYPARPSEPVAISFTFPVLVVALILGWRSTTSTRKRMLTTLILSSIYAFSLVLSYQLTVYPERRALPWSATEISESKWADGFLPDYDYELEARIPKHEFATYVARLRLEKCDANKLKHFSLLGHSAELENVYAREYYDGGTYAWMKNGVLHVHSFDM